MVITLIENGLMLCIILLIKLNLLFAKMTRYEMNPLYTKRHVYHNLLLNNFDRTRRVLFNI
jgi:hypothetical protein